MSLALRSVPLQLTEEALLVLAESYADYGRVSAYSPLRKRNSVATGRLGPSSGYQIRVQGTFLRLVSVVEAYVDASSKDLFGRMAIGQSASFRNLVASAEKSSADNWESRRSAFALYHSFRLTDLAGYQDLDKAILIRNAIAHGLGNLTTRQQTNADRAKVRQLGAKLANDRIILDSVALGKCYHSCRAFVEDLDSRLPRP